MGYIFLHNVIPERKQARYYALTWGPAIIGDGWAVERAWGALGSRRRQQKIDLVENADAALKLTAWHLRQRLQHGYTIKGADRNGQDLVAAQSPKKGKNHETRD